MSPKRGHAFCEEHCLKSSSLGIPTELRELAVINRIVSQIMFVISEIKTLHFNKHYQCYEVAVPTRRQVKIAYYNDFSCYLPYNESRAQGHQASRNHKFVCVRYDLDCC